MEASVPPEYQGNLLCINPDEQCFFGQEPYENILNAKARDVLFRSACKERKGGSIRCCPLQLVNVAYNPGPLDVPHMVMNGGYNNLLACPENVKSGCLRQSKRDWPLCVQNACNDAGYRVASNYYEVCKSTQMSGTKEDVPDCPTKGCWGNRFRIPEELDKDTILDQITSESVSDIRSQELNNNESLFDLEKKRDRLLQDVEKLKAERDAIYNQTRVEKAVLDKDKLRLEESFTSCCGNSKTRSKKSLDKMIDSLNSEINKINKRLINDLFDQNYRIKPTSTFYIFILVFVALILLCLKGTP